MSQKTLLENRVTVVATYRTEDKLNDLLQVVGALKDSLTQIKADVTDEWSVRNLVAKP